MLVLTVSVGCDNDAHLAQQARRQQKATKHQVQTGVDHLSEAFGYISGLVDLDPEAATRQITYHLNAWEPKESASAEPMDLAVEVQQAYPAIFGAVRANSPGFIPSDIEHFELCFLLSRVAHWVSDGELHDPILNEWINGLTGDQSADKRKLQTAARLFDWTIRNIRLEPNVRPDDESRPRPTDFPEDLTYGGAGYRQTLLQTLWRGSGDGLQRSRIFIALCHQLGLDACMLAVPGEDDQLRPWVVGLLIGERLYLFDASIGIHIPGPDLGGIATLADAQSDESVTRRMRVPGSSGTFEYPFDPAAVQQVTAWLDVPLETMCNRMKTLEMALTGDRRMVLSADPNRKSRIEALASIESAQFWPIEIFARRYDQAIEAGMASDAKVLFDEKSRWGMLDHDSMLTLKTARWNHLSGQFGRDEEERAGAVVGYIDQRVPDVDIENLPFDVEIQRQLGARRQLGQTEEQFSFQMKIAQSQFRMAKQVASFWVSIIKFEQGSYETAASWYQKRVLDRDPPSLWSDGARYNFARTHESCDRLAEAIELLKTDGDPQEHGNRLRARLLSRIADAGKADDES